MNKNLKEGSVIFITRRPFKFFSFRAWLSLLIEKFQGKVTHTAIVYKSPDGNMMVREMEKDGNIKIDLITYLKEYENRIYGIYEETKKSERLEVFNGYCHNQRSEYDFVNLLLKQPLKDITDIKLNSPLKRICSEDTARCYNVLFPNTFTDVESTQPSDVYATLSTCNT